MLKWPTSSFLSQDLLTLISPSMVGSKHLHDKYNLLDKICYMALLTCHPFFLCIFLDFISYRCIELAGTTTPVLLVQYCYSSDNLFLYHRALGSMYIYIKRATFYFLSHVITKRIFGRTYNFFEHAS